jgi:DNA repair exonuclease SbcCD ATPase subunit
MIRRLSLQNWRAYSNLDLTFEAGVTFVVAPNGVGKTSLVEGARFALYGEADIGAPPDEIVRLGAESATATIELELPSGAILTVDRELPRKLPRNRRPPVTAQLVGRQLDEAALNAVLRDAYAADASFLSRLTMLRGDAFHTSTDLKLREHLSEYFGIGALQQASDAIDIWLKRVDREIRATKQANPVGPRRMNELRQAAQAANDRVIEATRRHDEATRAAAASSEEERLVAAHAQWQQRQASRTTALQTIMRDAASLGIAVETPDNLIETLDAHEGELTNQVDDARRAKAQAEGHSTAIRLALDELEGAGAICPVCRRPLSAEEAATAGTEHRADLQRLASDAAAAADRVDRLQEQVVFVRQLRQTVQRVLVTEAEPPAPGRAAEEVAAASRTATDAQQRAMEALVEARTSAAAAARDSAAAERDTAAEQQLRRQYSAYAIGETTRQALRRTTDTLLNGTIEPLTLEIADRWKRMFPDRGPVSFSPDGQLTRQVNGETLPFSAFSGGEQVGAQLLLRLLVLQTATKAEFCWIDEPLEHLDPATRRHVVSLVARIATTTSLKQIVMTTYEEPLAWRVARRAPDRVRLTYVRAQPNP